VTSPHVHGLALLTLSLAACQRAADAPAGVLPPAAQVVPSTSLLRLPRAGGSPRFYSAPALADLGWRARGRLPAMQLAVGFDLDQELAYAVDSSRGLQGLDVTTGTARVLTKDVRGVVLGPEGTLWVVDDQNGIVRVRRRFAERLDAALPGRPVALYGTGDRQLLAIEGGDSAAAYLVAGLQAGARKALPSVHTAASPWGDLLAVAAETGVYLWAPHGETELRRVRIGGTPRTVRFSASGHRIYVGRESEDLAVIDRYSGDRLDDIAIPGAAAGLRVAPYGAWLLARPDKGDTVWVVNLATGKYAGMVAAPWSADLPTVLGDATLLVRRGADVVALDLNTEAFPEVGRIKGGANDLYLPVPWLPAANRPAEAAVASATPDSLAAAAATPSAPDTGGAAPVNAVMYLQVSRSQNPTWAQALAEEIRKDGFPALVLDPKAGEEAFRVVVGPYPSREAAESAGRRLGRPSFIYQP